MGPTIGAAARALARGSLVVVPTDTLYALAARATDPRAVERLFVAKGRPADRRVSVAVSSTVELETWGALSAAERRFARRELPGPWTMLVRPSETARRALAPAVVGGPRLGLRVPDHPLVRELARRLGPITATSANRSGEPPARTLREARAALGRSVALYLDGPPRPSGTPSTLVRFNASGPVRVRRR